MMTYPHIAPVDRLFGLGDMPPCSWTLNQVQDDGENEPAPRLLVEAALIVAR